MLLFYALLACGDKDASETILDNDNDGFAATIDCDDDNPSIHPEAIEICDSIDNDCDGDIDENLPTTTLFFDADQDGFGGSDSVDHCDALDGYTWIDGDCDDSDDTVFPDAEEFCDTKDNDCNGTIDDNASDAPTVYADSDGDGYGNPSQSMSTCTAETGWVDNAEDCDDGNAAINSDSVEICDSIDNDCDGLIDDEDDSLDPVTATPYYQDNDGDGFGDISTETLTCTAPGDYVDNGLDCDDTSIWTSPLVTNDTCDGQDNDCDGVVDEDVKPGWPLVTIHEFFDGMVEIDPVTAQLLTTHPLTNIGNVWSMDVSESGTAVIHSDYGGLRIGFLDACNNQVTFLPPHNTSGIGCGIAFGPNGNLYAINGTNNSLYQIDTISGQATFIGALGINIVNCGIAYDCANDTLIGATASTDQIFKINHQTGAAYDFIQTSVPLTYTVGMEFNAADNSVYLATEDDLYQVDLATGSSTYIGETSSAEPDWYINDLAFHPPCP